MILLDTNVLSALMLRVPDMAVVRWLDQQPSESIWTTAITVFEVKTGLELLPDSRRRQQLERSFNEILDLDLGGRVLTFDRAAALTAGAIAAARGRAGHDPEVRDTEIAGIVAARRATLATRNVKHFTGLGIELVDPWDV